MTEDQAAKKLCPGGPGTGQGNGLSDQQFCVGNECMAWRWDVVSAPVFPMTPDGPDLDHGHTGIFLSETDGYCGLGGAPMAEYRTAVRELGRR